MSTRPAKVLGLVVGFLLLGQAARAEPPADPSRDVRELANKIDQHLARGWKEAGVKPAPPATDAEFLRRVYLDLAGRIPSVSEARTFLNDTRPDRRARLVDQLLDGSSYVRHFTNVYRAMLIPEANNNFLVRFQQTGFEAWLKRRVAKNVGYDDLARDLITSPLGQEGLAAFALGASGQPSPLAFYAAKEYRAENLAAGTARVFLGISVECAQCHNHPFADWKREQFWGFAAFYSGINSQRVQDFLLPAAEEPTKRELTIPETTTIVKATYLDGTQPAWKEDTQSRAKLAEWVTSPDNPYFSRATVNRMWAYFLGTGLVEPVDEMVGTSTTEVYPELLNLLAREFADHDFDVKFLIRALTATRAYQLTSAATSEDQDEPTVFARAHLRGMTAEQLFDSVAMATGYRDIGPAGNDLITGIIGGNRSARSEFLTKFQSTERPNQAQTSILQALSLMNGRVTADATSLKNSETLAAVVDAPFASTAERIETLYLATLSRKPSEKELSRMTAFIDRAVARAKTDKETAVSNALGDVFWVLLNSSEFTLNH